MEKFLTSLKDLIKSFRFILPFIFIIGVIYAFYARFTKSEAEQTIEDIIYITTKIREGRQEVLFKDFNNDTVVFSGFLPIDLKTSITNKGYSIRNRFGSEMSFREAYKTKQEKDYYENLKKYPEAYEYRYVGTNAYIITFHNIRRSACVNLAQHNWKKDIPNFLGIEVGRINKFNPMVGIERLNMGLLAGLMEIDYDGPDQSFVSNRTLQYREAFKECRCLLHNKCIVSLKFTN